MKKLIGIISALFYVTGLLSTFGGVSYLEKGGDDIDFIVVGLLLLLSGAITYIIQEEM